MRCPILQNPDPILRKLSKEVSKSEFGSTELLKIIKNMRDTLAGEGDGVALAAPQIGINKRIFVIAGKVFSMDDNLTSTTPDIVCINPVITKISRDKKMMHEGCLSVRPLYGDIRRASRATIHAKNEHGESFELSGSGLLAEIFQHEIDHLDGVLFIDNAVNIKDGEPRTLKKQRQVT